MNISAPSHKAIRHQAVSAPRPAVRPISRTAVSTVYEVTTAYTPSPVVPYSVDSDLLNKRLENKYKALIALEEQAIPTRPQMRIHLQRQIALGETWKIVGRVPELGRFIPEVAPVMVWSEGHHWTYQARIRPGTWTFKMVLRRPDGAYFWEQGPDRVIDVPEDAGPDDIIELEIDNIQMPGM